MVISNAEIKQIRSLREKKFRDMLGLFVVEGEKMVREALDSGLDVVKVWRSEEIGESAMERISAFSSPSPVLAVVRKPQEKSNDTIVPEGLCLALDGVRDPGNLGTIIRIADWFGVSRIFVSADCVETFNPKVIQASMGSIFRVEVIRCDVPATCRRFREEGLPVYGTFLDGNNLYKQDIASEGLIVMGNESNGVSAATAAEVNARLFIPSYGDSRAESLNVAVATAVTLAEFRRR